MIGLNAPVRRMTFDQFVKHVGRRWLILAMAASLSGGSAVLCAEPVTDCPLAHSPYSSGTVLLDLLLDPVAKAVLEP